MPNRLINETSPYLLQHANNPVDWYPWGEDALARARDEDKPILLSIGYSACHWCHVMERESFENEAIAGMPSAAATAATWAQCRWPISRSYWPGKQKRGRRADSARYRAHERAGGQD